jgi:hypothetical protein
MLLRKMNQTMRAPKQQHTTIQKQTPTNTNKHQQEKKEGKLNRQTAKKGLTANSKQQTTNNKQTI